MSDDPIAKLFTATSAETLDDCLAKIVHCVDQLSEADLLWRPTEEMNSIGNIILHLCGNVGQWIVSGVGGAPDVRNRPAEFAERRTLAKSELLDQLRTTVALAKDALYGCDSDNLERIRHVQHGSVTGLYAAYHSIAHFYGHTQEITYITRLRLGERYRFLGITASSD